MIRALRCLNLLFPAVLASAPLLCVAQGQDELWEITMSMQMEGMSMPEQAQRVCKPKGKQSDEDLVPKDKECRVTDWKQSGNKTTFNMVCEGKSKMTGTGEFIQEKDGYRGTMRAKGTADGEPFDMTQKFAGKRVGNCTYEDPVKKSNAMIAEQCNRGMDEMQWPLFTMEGAMCKDRKAEFCGKVAKMTQDMRDPAGYRAAVSKRGDWAQLAQACGQDPAAITADACKRSVSAKDWEFVMQHCEAEGKALAKQNCEGRSYTAAMSSVYAPLCSRYTSFGGRSYTAALPRHTEAAPAATAGTPAQEAKKPSATDQIKEGAGKLKKFLKF